MTPTPALPPWAKHESSLIQVLFGDTIEAVKLQTWEERAFSARYLVPYMAQPKQLPALILPFLRAPKHSHQTKWLVPALVRFPAWRPAGCSLIGLSQARRPEVRGWLGGSGCAQWCWPDGARLGSDDGRATIFHTAASCFSRAGWEGSQWVASWLPKES